LAARLAEQEERSGDVVKARKQIENDCQQLRKQYQDVEMSLKKIESEKASKDHAIRALQVCGYWNRKLIAFEH
jgi:septal ring factor EnvC (AmiA/AmiB activator)